MYKRQREDAVLSRLNGQAKSLKDIFNIRKAIIKLEEEREKRARAKTGKAFRENESRRSLLERLAADPNNERLQKAVRRSNAFQPITNAAANNARAGINAPPVQLVKFSPEDFNKLNQKNQPIVNIEFNLEGIVDGAEDFLETVNDALPEMIRGIFN